jgi:hypothetical protein
VHAGIVESFSYDIIRIEGRVYLAVEGKRAADLFPIGVDEGLDGFGCQVFSGNS